jgi:hypothetical protein
MMHNSTKGVGVAVERSERALYMSTLYMCGEPIGSDATHTGLSAFSRVAVALP